MAAGQRLESTELGKPVQECVALWREEQVEPERLQGLQNSLGKVG